MELRDSGRQPLHEIAIQCASLGQPIEELLLIEASHFEQPVDRGTRSTQRERPVLFARDRDDAQIQARRRSPIDPQFRLAHGLSTIGGREIQVPVTDGALELQRTGASEKHHRRMRLDALHLRTAMC